MEKVTSRMATGILSRCSTVCEMDIKPTGGYIVFEDGGYDVVIDFGYDDEYTYLKCEISHVECNDIVDLDGITLFEEDMTKRQKELILKLIKENDKARKTGVA